MARAKRFLELGDYIHLIELAAPGTPVPDGDGGYTEAAGPLDPPTMRAAIDLASARDLERIAPGTVISQATHIVRLDYHPGITTKTVITFAGRTLNVTYVRNPEELNERLELVCAEIVE